MGKLDIEWSDRYGGHWPDPATVCKGHCEGTGFVPIFLPGKDREPPVADGQLVPTKQVGPVFKELWLAAEKESPSEDGYHFVRCPDCKGTGKRTAVACP